jgi:hypothetical protein
MKNICALASRALSARAARAARWQQAAHQWQNGGENEGENGRRRKLAVKYQRSVKRSVKRRKAENVSAENRRNLKAENPASRGIRRIIS